MRGVLIVLSIVVFTLSILLSGFTVSTLWGWFVVPLGMQAIGVAHGVGLSVFISYFGLNGYQMWVKKQTDKRSEIAKTAYAFSIPATSLFIGWVVTLFM